MVTNEKTGLLSAYGNIDDFADNIIFLLQNPSTVSTMSINAHKQALNYVWDSIASKIERVYLSVM